jgi:protein involved in polysaccharide export with SLBB domain
VPIPKPDLAACSARTLVPALLAALVGGGCIGSRIVYPVLPTPEELREFEAAGPADMAGVELDTDSMQVSGPYRVVPGDLLEIELPSKVQIDTASSEAPPPATLAVKCRVADDGTILLPMVANQHVAGKTTAEIEDLLVQEYQLPARLEEPPNVVVTISEYRTESVAVIGAVNQQGLHELRSDHLTVLGALMAAGGIKKERGAREIVVIGRDENGQKVSRSLGVEMAEIPLEDVALRGGETVVVEPAPERAFSVIGLVKRSGVFPYPAPRRYNLMQALATAGGVDENAAPRYATVYRTRADGKVIGATFKIDGTSLTDGPNVWIKDGDVIAVDHTQGSWLRQFFSQVFGFRASVSVSTAASPAL